MVVVDIEHCKAELCGGWLEDVRGGGENERGPWTAREEARVDSNCGRLSVGATVAEWQTVGFIGV